MQRRISAKIDQLGESPVWDNDNQCLYWVDGVSRLIRRYEPATGAFDEWQAPSTIGCVALGEGRTLVAGLVDGIYRFDLDTGAFTPVFRPEPTDPLARMNDGRTDRQGRLVVGGMGLHADPRAKLYRVDGEGRADVVSEGICISNATCFSPSGDVMYFADSLEGTIRAYPYGSGGDLPGAPAVLCDTRQWGSGPDGATVDADGYIWATLVRAGKIARISPDGKLDRLIDAPTDLPSSVAFGGHDLSTLFVTSIKDSGSGRAISQHPDGGALFAIDGLGVRGLPEARFPKSRTSGNDG
ncbi:MAG: SMP-30/gluconolactonase/LRE family protein [Mesorhizobium sp.]